MARVLVISFSNLASDPRVDRQIAALATQHEIVAAGFGPPRHDFGEYIGLEKFYRRFGRVVTPGLLLARRYERHYWTHPTIAAALDRLAGVQVDVVVANDMLALPLALRLGPPVVFDAHEYSPRQISDRLWWRLTFAPFVSWQCRRYIPQAAAMMTVGPAIADQYERFIGVRASVVTNAPPYAELEPTPVHEPVRILHHGGATPGRRLEDMIRVLDLLDERFTLDFVLVAGVSSYIEDLVRRARGNPRIRFREPQPMHLIPSMANDYDIGLYMLPPVNFNHRYALPNKLFEFIQGRLAVAIGPSPEMARVVRQHGCGVVADDFTPETMAAALSALDDSAIAEFKRASHLAASELNAERNAELVLGVVEQALASRNARAAYPTR